jgi:flagellar basal-body rod protein FlgF
MDNTLLIGLSQQMAMRRQMEIIANNIANMSTTAFKAEDVLFREYPMRVLSGDLRSLELSFVEDVAVIRNLAEGDMEHTGGPLDLAIAGEGFFTVETPAGVRYTRNGHFTLDGEGRIVTHDGHALLSQGGGELVITTGERDITIAEDGTLSTSAGPKGRIAIVRFGNQADMEAIGASLYKTDQTPEPATGAKVVQGALEQSNVSPVVEMTKMLEMVRAYQAVTNIMERADELARRAIREMGQVPQA